MRRISKTPSLVLVAALHVAPVSPAASADRTLLNACFSPQALAGMPGEEIAKKGDHAFDRATKLAAATPSPPISDDLRGSIRRVELPKGSKLIALTFDLCEQRGEVAGYDGRIIDYLRNEGVKATFFAGGKWMASHQARTEQLMLDPLFEIGNHTETHQNLRLLSPDAVQQEILAPQTIFAETRGHLATRECIAPSIDAMDKIAARLTLFRFPYGACNEAALKAVNDAGMLAIQWDLSTGDPDPRETGTQIAEAMLREARPGSIIIGHANGRGWHTYEALPIAIPKLKAKGYQFVTVSELLSAGKPVITTGCYDRKPGDTNRYDFLARMAHPLNSGAQKSAIFAPAQLKAGEPTPHGSEGNAPIPAEHGTN